MIELLAFLCLGAVAAAVVGARPDTPVGNTPSKVGSRPQPSDHCSYRHRTAGGHTFGFDFVPQKDGKVRIYIKETPSYVDRPTDGHSTHRFFDPERGYYVCVRDDLAPTNIAEAREWARYWAEGTSTYITNGKEFS